MRWLSFIVLALFAQPAFAEVYAYTNLDGDYVVSQTRPTDDNLSYAVLTDDGEFVRMVEGKSKRMPISHWRPFFLPKDPHPMDGPAYEPREREPSVDIEEVSPED